MLFVRVCVCERERVVTAGVFEEFGRVGGQRVGRAEGEEVLQVTCHSHITQTSACIYRDMLKRGTRISI